MAYEPIRLISLEDEMPDLNGSWHLFYYIPSRRLTEPFSISIIKFKDGNRFHTERWIDIAIAELSKLDIPFDYIVRPLGSKELEITRNKSLDKLGEALAGHFNAIFHPEIFKKMHHIPALHTIRGVVNGKGAYVRRYEALAQSYRIRTNKPRLRDSKRLLIIDDISTSCATAEFLKDLVLSQYPDLEIYFFALAKTTTWHLGEYDTTVNNRFDPSILRA